MNTVTSVPFKERVMMQSISSLEEAARRHGVRIQVVRNLQLDSCVRVAITVNGERDHTQFLVSQALGEVARHRAVLQMLILIATTRQHTNPERLLKLFGAGKLPGVNLRFERIVQGHVAIATESFHKRHPLFAPTFYKKTVPVGVVV